MNDEAPMILVQGIGQVRLDQAKKRVQEMIDDLSYRVKELTTDPETDQNDWHKVDILLKRGALQAYVDAIAQTIKKQH